MEEHQVNNPQIKISILRLFQFHPGNEYSYMTPRIELNTPRVVPL